MRELYIYKLIKQHDRRYGTFFERHYCLTMMLASVTAISFLTALAMFVLVTIVRGPEQWAWIALPISVISTLCPGFILFSADWTTPESRVHDDLLRAIASSDDVSTELKSSLRLALSLSDDAVISRSELDALIHEEETRLDTLRRESGPGYQAIMAAQRPQPTR